MRGVIVDYVSLDVAEGGGPPKIDLVYVRRAEPVVEDTFLRQSMLSFSDH